VSLPRVLHIDTGEQWRGGQHQVFLLHRLLLARGVPSKVLARRGGALEERCRGTGLPVGCLPGRRPWSLAAVSQVRQELDGHDILHLHDSHAAGLAAVALWRRAWPRVVCHRRVAYPMRPLARWRFKYRKVARWIAVSHEVATRLHAAGVGASRCRVIPSAVDVDDLVTEATASHPEETKTRHGIPSSAPLIGVVGALTRDKGQHVLLEAAPLVLREHPCACFVVAGDGPMRAELEVMVAHRGIGPSVRLLGFQRRVAELLHACTVIVVPSLESEGSPAAVKEPMALAKPVVASDQPGIREVLGEAGVLVTPGDPRELARAINELLGDETRCSTLGRAAWRRVQAFRPEAMVDATLAVYAELIDGSQDGSHP
jgi:glycosyltransferase involved in cell wall biosynthesis